MIAFLYKIHKDVEPLFKKGGPLELLYPIYEAQETFLFQLGETTKRASHVRDPLDSKRMMSTVIVALLPCLFFGIWNAGYQAHVAQGISGTFWEYMLYGAIKVLPIVLVSYAVGGISELVFCLVKREEINEGFLVTGMLYPLSLAPTTPLWQVAIGIIFGIIIGKEVFGGTGFNILNPALTARVFVFFAYPASISGDAVWTAVDGYTSATPLLYATGLANGADVVQALQTYSVNGIAGTSYSLENMFLGLIPGSIGETSTLACLIGAVFLIATGVGNWRTMLGCCFGVFVCATLLNAVAGPDSNPAMHLPFYYHYVMGSFAFGAVYMATDPVSSSQTQKGMLIYGFFIGLLCVLIRVVNPAYPEGMMLAILFMNVFAPAIDHYVLRGHIKARKKRADELAAGGLA